jgi:hypothetical protein
MIYRLCTLLFPPVGQRDKYSNRKIDFMNFRVAQKLTLLPAKLPISIPTPMQSITQIDKYFSKNQFAFSGFTYRKIMNLTYFLTALIVML